MRRLANSISVQIYGQWSCNLHFKCNYFNGHSYSQKFSKFTCQLTNHFENRRDTAAKRDIDASASIWAAAFVDITSEKLFLLLWFNSYSQSNYADLSLSFVFDLWGPAVHTCIWYRSKFPYRGYVHKSPVSLSYSYLTQSLFLAPLLLLLLR